MNFVSQVVPYRVSLRLLTSPEYGKTMPEYGKQMVRPCPNLSDKLEAKGDALFTGAGLDTGIVCILLVIDNGGVGVGLMAVGLPRAA